MLCSILLPTRGRAKRLETCIGSIMAHGTPALFEILLGIDEDDLEMRHQAKLIRSMHGNVRALISERGEGWHELGRRYTELAEFGKGVWVWMFNDDCELHGANWTEQLSQMPDDCIVHPEIHRLGQSVYREDKTGGFPIVPNGCWRDFGFDALAHPSDKFLNDICRDRGWPTRFLPGVELSHQRIADDILPAERL